MLFHVDAPGILYNAKICSDMKQGCCKLCAFRFCLFINFQLSSNSSSPCIQFVLLRFLRCVPQLSRFWSWMLLGSSFLQFFPLLMAVGFPAIRFLALDVVEFFVMGCNCMHHIMFNATINCAAEGNAPSEALKHLACRLCVKD